MIDSSSEHDGYFDLQVNGYAGVDFNAPDLSLEQVELACTRMTEDGVAGALAAIVTADLPLMCDRIGRIARYSTASDIVGRVIRGVHVEGPFINPEPGYVGAHPVEFVRPSDVGDAERLLDAGEGFVRLVTLAPEHDDDFAVTRLLAEQGVTVSAGHCDPSSDTLAIAIEWGLSMFTHLGNGCAAMFARHDNIIQRVLAMSDRLHICFIADGVHVPWFALGNYLRVTGFDRAIVVSDAIAATGMGAGRFQIGEIPVDVGDDGVARYGDTGYLAGSCTPMHAAATNLAERLGLDAASIHKLTRDNPRRAIGLHGDPA